MINENNDQIVIKTVNELMAAVCLDDRNVLWGGYFTSIVQIYRTSLGDLITEIKNEQFTYRMK